MSKFKIIVAGVFGVAVYGYLGWLMGYSNAQMSELLILVKSMLTKETMMYFSIGFACFMALVLYSPYDLKMKMRKKLLRKRLNEEELSVLQEMDEGTRNHFYNEYENVIKPEVRQQIHHKANSIAKGAAMVKYACLLLAISCFYTQNSEAITRLASMYTNSLTSTTSNVIAATTSNNPQDQMSADESCESGCESKPVSFIKKGPAKAHTINPNAINEQNKMDAKTQEILNLILNGQREFTFATYEEADTMADNLLEFTKGVDIYIHQDDVEVDEYKIYYTPEDLKLAQKELLELLNGTERAKKVIVNALSSMNLYASDEEVVRQINDYIVNNYRYQITDLPWYTFTDLGYGQCFHYAMLFQKMCTVAGIPCEYVAGDADGENIYGREGHAWNRVLVDGSWYYIDVCWNDVPGDYEYYLSETLWSDHWF